MQNPAAIPSDSSGAHRLQQRADAQSRRRPWIYAGAVGIALAFCSAQASSPSVVSVSVSAEQDSGMVVRLPCEADGYLVGQIEVTSINSSCDSANARVAGSGAGQSGGAVGGHMMPALARVRVAR